MELKREVRGNAIQIVDDVLANTERRVSSCGVCVAVQEKISSVL